MDYTIGGIPKNTLQLLLGSALYVTLSGGSFSWLSLILAVIGINLVYSAVYIYNDLCDYHDDVKDPLKRSLKKLARGDLTRKQARIRMRALLALGLAVSVFVNLYFLAAMAGLFFLNFLYSNNRIKLKKRFCGKAFFFFTSQVLKYSSGWIALGVTLNNFPFLLMALLGFIYVAMAYFYKNINKPFWKIATTPSIIISATIAGLLFNACVLVYPFKLPFLFGTLAFLLTGAIFFVPTINIEKRSILMLCSVYVILAVFTASILLVNVPPFSDLNNFLISLQHQILNI